MVELKTVSKSYPGGVQAVNRLSLTLQTGEILSLLGPSGCGKTTVLRMIAGFEWPDEGSIAIGGRRVAGDGTRVEPERRGVGMVFQDYPLFPYRTVAQNVAFGLHKLPRKQAMDRALEVLELVGLKGYDRRYPHQLSGGQQQRVALAQALAPEPNVILLDEPFSNLDASLRQDVRLQVREILKKAGATGILVTHDQKEAFTVGDVVAVMNAGQIEQIGTPYELYSRPKTRFVAQFLGHCALLEGTVQQDAPGVLTDLGLVPCSQCPANTGERVTVSLRPDSLLVDPNGPLKGAVESIAHEGHALELTVKIPCGAHFVRARALASPELPVKAGDHLRFSIAPDRVAVIS